MELLPQSILDQLAANGRANLERIEACEDTIDFPPVVKLLPFPDVPVGPMGELPLSVRAMAAAPRGSGLSEKDYEARMGIGEPGSERPLDADVRPDQRRVRAAVLADDHRQFEMDFEATSGLSVEAVRADDAALVEDALGDLERFEGEIANRTETA